MRKVDTALVAETIAALCLEAATKLPDDVTAALKIARAGETWPNAIDVLDTLAQNIECAKSLNLPLCQDTGMACVFVELGQGVQLVGRGLNEAIHDGVRRGYGDNYLRKSVVGDPLRRKNTGDNTPALIHLDIVEGEHIKLTLLPKGFGSENMSRIAMLTPSAGEAGVKDFIVDTVLKAGASPCPPIVLGVGIGGSFDTAPAIAKKSLLRPIGSVHKDPYYAAMEAELLERINKTGIGPAGYGGKTTALAVHIATQPTHIAGLPVAVNVACHAMRRASAII